METKKRSIFLLTSISVLLCITLIAVINLKSNFNITTVEVSGINPHYELDELVEKSHIIAKGKITGQSDPFIVKPTNNGDESVFTDYYFELSEVLRGEKSSGDTISIRVEGGKKGKWNVVNETDVGMKIGDEVVAFLYKVNVGGGYTTNEDYYLIVAGNQGMYFIDENSNENIYKNTITNDSPLIWEKALYELTSISKEKPINYNWVYDEVINNLKANVETGFMTNEEYEKTLVEFNQNTTKYATKTE